MTQDQILESIKSHLKERLFGDAQEYEQLTEQLNRLLEMLKLVEAPILWANDKILWCAQALPDGNIRTLEGQLIHTGYFKPISSREQLSQIELKGIRLTTEAHAKAQTWYPDADLFDFPEMIPELIRTEIAEFLTTDNDKTLPEHLQQFGYTVNHVDGCLPTNLQKLK